MKKIITTIFITVLALMLTIAPMTGCSTCEHDVSSWTVVTEATCTHTGLKEGICGICYKTVQEEIPIDPDAHEQLGEWSVTAPTVSKTGVAVADCAACGGYVSITLPPIDGTEERSDGTVVYYDDVVNYTSKITTRPTAASNGISQYTYPTEYGDITFNIEIGSDGIQSVTDAVSVSTMTESHDLVRSATGYRGSQYYEYANSPNNTELVTADFSYELYDEYTHIIADDGSEFWLGYDNGEVYGYREDEKGNFTALTNTNYIDGFQYYEVYTDTLSYYYGTENFLNGVYSYAKNNANGDMTESVTTRENEEGETETVYSFSFGTYTIYSGGTRGGMFSVITVSFTLSASYTIEWLEYYSTIYENDSTYYVYNDETEAYEWSSEAPFNFDDDGHAYVQHTNGSHYTEIIEVNQELKKDGDTEETMPYTPDTRFYEDFDIAYDGSTVNYTSVTKDNTTTDYEAAVTASLVAGSTTGYDFTVTNLDSTILGDTITFYYKQYDSLGNYEYVEINVNTESSVGIFVHLKSDYSFCIKSNITGDVTIAVSTRKVTKEFTLTFTSNAPTELYPTVYEYDSSVGYVADTPTTYTNTATVYVGQPLYYNTALSSTEQGSCTNSFTTTVACDDSEAEYVINDSTSVYLNSSGEYVSLSSFTAYKAGTYTLTLTSTEDKTVTCTITVTVVEAPTLDSLFTGTYTGTFCLTGNNVAVDSIEVTFGEITKTTVTLTTESGSTVNAYMYTVTATVSYVLSPTVVCTWYTSLDGSVIYNVTSYEQTYAAEDMVSSSTSDEWEDEYYFTISVNEAFCITITHTAGDPYNSTATAVLSH